LFYNEHCGYIRHAIEILTFFTVGIKGMGTGPSFSIMGNISSIEWDVIECLLYGECHAPLCVKDKLKKLLK